MSKGQRIRSRREELGLGQTELAEKVNISKQTLYKYENDIVTNIPSDKVEEIARALETTPAYIMGWNDIDGIIHEEMVFTQPLEPSDKYSELIQAYSKASPEIRKAVELILKSNQSDS